MSFDKYVRVIVYRTLLLEEYMHDMFLTSQFGIMKLLDTIYGCLIIMDCFS